MSNTFEVTVRFHVALKGNSLALSVDELVTLWLFQQCGSVHEVEDPNTGNVVGELEFHDYDPEYDKVETKPLG